MSARRKGNKWYADFIVAGERYREFGFAAEDEAEAWELEARAAIKRGKPLPPGPKSERAPSTSSGLHTIKGLIDHVEKVRWASMKSTASVEAARLFEIWTGPQMATREALTPLTIGEYVEHLREERGCSGSTINRRLASVSALMKAAAELRIIEGTFRLPKQREGEGRIRWFTDEEEEAILSTLRVWGEHMERDLFIFLVDTGARLGEAEKLEWRDVAPGERSVTFWETKAGNHRSVPLTERVREALRRRRAVSGNQPGPFSDMNRSALRSLWERLRTRHGFLGSAVIHTFRHTCASRLVQKGVDIMRVRVWMGHKTVATTLRYAHLAPQHLDDVLRVLEGGGAKR